jgi:hypothetical protein
MAAQERHNDVHFPDHIVQKRKQSAPFPHGAKAAIYLIR